MRANNLSGIVLRVAAVLLCLVLFSAHLASGMFAKYSVGTSESNDAQVAKIDVSAVETQALTLDNDGNATYKFLVKNNSEVAYQYDVCVRIATTSEYAEIFDPSEIAGACSDIKLNDVSGTLSASGSKYTFSVSDYIAPDSESDEYVLTFKATDLLRIADESSGSAASYNDVPIKLSVSAKGTQVN